VPTPLELLAPARDADTGIAAIEHGADAVYIGGPAFGARAEAGNSIAEIERLVRHAHLYHARVRVALNTILRNDELEAARRIAWQAWEAGADALIVQDMGLLELDLPPIQLHASTQTDIRSPAKARFLQDVGFSQIVLARELSLDEIRAIRAATSCVLEFFVHGALCVAYSGQCYISHAHTGRSANRGECAQPCRLPYSLADGEGRVLVRDQHLLSLKDNDQSDNLAELAEAGIGSFKIEGRLKDIAYVKNVTAHYRQRLDALIDSDPRYRRASSGRCQFMFTPRPEKTFNRGRTDYFLHGRRPDIGAFGTPKFMGEVIGQVTARGPDWFEVDGDAALANGDGLCFYDSDQILIGLRVNRAEDRRLYPAPSAEGRRMLPSLGARIYRNRDQAFERQLEKRSAERRIAVHMRLEECANGFILHLCDEDGIRARSVLDHAKEAARAPESALQTLREHLGKLGGTPFFAESIEIAFDAPWFLPVRAINPMRRECLAQLEDARRRAWQRPPRATPVQPPPAYPDSALDYLGNVLNERARAFYARHGVQRIEPAYEANRETGAVSLMITRHCIRFSLNLCPKQVKGITAEPLQLISGDDRLTLRFDCKKCEMHVVGKPRKNRVVHLTATR